MTDATCVTVDRDELKRLQADAERYRFLRRTKSWQDALPYDEKWIVESYDDVINLSGDSLDDSIDAAILIEQGEKQ